MANKTTKVVEPERSALITIGGEEYELVLSTRATKEIAKRYGGLDNLGEKLLRAENFELALEEIVWLITLLANQSILIHNLRNQNEQREPLSEDVVELLTTPLELSGFKAAITEAMFKGTSRNILSEESESESKNAKAE